MSEQNVRYKVHLVVGPSSHILEEIWSRGKDRGERSYKSNTTVQPNHYKDYKPRRLQSHMDSSIDYMSYNCELILPSIVCGINSQPTVSTIVPMKCFCSILVATDSRNFRKKMAQHHLSGYMAATSVSPLL